MIPGTYRVSNACSLIKVEFNFQTVCHLLNNLEVVFFLDRRVFDLQRVVIDVWRLSALEHSYHLAAHFLAFLYRLGEAIAGSCYALDERVRHTTSYTQSENSNRSFLLLDLLVEVGK